MHCDSINNYLDAKFGYGFAFDEINIKKKKKRNVQFIQSQKQQPFKI